MSSVGSLLPDAIKGSRGISPGSGKKPPLGGMGSYRIEAMTTTEADHHPVFFKGNVAVITGAASGIGFSASKELAKIGMRIAMADVNEVELKAAAEKVAKIAGQENVIFVPTDVSKLEDVVAFKDRVVETWSEVSVLMNNAGVGHKGGKSWEGLDVWNQIFAVNVFGMLNVQQTFVPLMIHQENSAVIINTGSKQGITNPPGNAAYNASKAAIRSLTEGLSHELRALDPTERVTAHLFIPGWTYTGLTGAPTPSSSTPYDKPGGAWSAQETVLYMLEHVKNGDFYIVVPDNETKKEVDVLRMMWAAGDIAENRPALSRWHKDYKSMFEEYMRDGLDAMQ